MMMILIKERIHAGIVIRGRLKKGEMSSVHVKPRSFTQVHTVSSPDKIEIDRFVSDRLHHIRGINSDHKIVVWMS